MRSSYEQPIEDPVLEDRVMIKGFKNFLMQGSVVVIAIGLMVALAFSTLIKAFTDAIINPILNRFQGGSGIGLDHSRSPVY